MYIRVFDKPTFLSTRRHMIKSQFVEPPKKTESKAVRNNL